MKQPHDEHSWQIAHVRVRRYCTQTLIGAPRAINHAAKIEFKIKLRVKRIPTS